METLIKETVYKDGFNRGYWLLNYEPDVAKLLMESSKDKTDEFSIGFSEGIHQAKQEKTLNEFEQLRNNNEQQQDLEQKL